LSVRGNNVAQERLGAFDIDGEIVVNARAFNIRSSFTTLSLVRNLMESPKKPVTVQNSHP
jgi:hypothetical protein